MKAILLSFLEVVMIHMTLNSQSPCLPGGIVFTTQQQIDDFQAGYPDCDEIEGFVTISGESITNLNGLNVLTSIAGNLWIDSNPLLTDLSGLENLIQVGGYLNVSNNQLIIDLSGLDSLSLVGGSIFISTNPSLVNLSGLENITNIHNNLLISNNSNLIDLSGLDGLTGITGNLAISINNSLISLEGFNNLSLVGGDLSVSFNVSLQNLQGLNGLLFVGGDLLLEYNSALNNCIGINSLTSVGDDFGIHENNGLANLIGFGALTSIGGELNVSGNDALTGLNGLNALASLGGDLYIGHNTALTNISSLQSLINIGGDLKIEFNNNILDLGGLDNVNAGSISNLYIQNNPSLYSCDAGSVCDYLVAPNGIIFISNNANGCNDPAEVQDDCENQQECLPEGITFDSQDDIDYFQFFYPGCTEIVGNVKIESSGGGSVITNLDGLLVLMKICGKLEITGNDSLTDLSGLNNLSCLGSSLEVMSNNLISTLSGLENLIVTGGMVSVRNNQNLTSLDGIDNLNYVGKDPNGFGLWIEENNNLGDLAGLESLISLEGDLFIKSNGSLMNLSGLNNLNYLGGGITIMDHPLLISLAGLDNLGTSSILFLNINNNNSLTNCDIMSVCEYLIIPGGTVDIHDNATGCNSPEEVHQACLLTDTYKNIGNEKFLIMPNPSADKITILTYDLTENTNLSIFNVSGNKVLEKKIKSKEIQIDISALPQGVYFVRVQDEKMTEVTKLVKQ